MSQVFKMSRVFKSIGTSAFALLVLSLLPAFLVDRAEARRDGTEIEVEGSVVVQGMFCARSGCHDSEAGSTFNLVATVDFEGLPSSFTAGQTIQFQVVTQGGNSTEVYGLNLAVLYEDGSEAGRLINLTPGLTEHEFAGVRTLVHSPIPLTTDRVLVRWQAPSEPTGDVLFRVAVNAANDNNDPSFDHIATREVQLPWDRPVQLSESYFAQIGDGVGSDVRFQTTIVLVNTGGLASRAEVDFFDSQGEPMVVPLGELEPSSHYEIDLGPGESFSGQTTGSGEIRVGYARVLAAAGIGGTAVFTGSLAEGGVALFEAGVPTSTVLTDFSLFVDQTGDRRTGVALVNAQGSAANVTFRIYDKQFTAQSAAVLRVLQSGEHLARFVDELFSDLPTDFEQGVLTVESDLPIAAVTLRQTDSPSLTFPADVPVLAAFPVIPGRGDQE